MKTLYKLPVIVAMIFVMVGCSNSLTYQEAMNKNEHKINDAARLNDARFLVASRSFNLLEMKSAELATTAGYASAVVDLARKFLDDHRNMDEDLATLARKEKISLPSSMSDEHQSTYYQISKSDREDFDAAYIKTIQRINEENKEQYMRMATDAQDADIRAFAARKLDMINDHASKLEQVNQKLMNTY